MSNIVFIKIEIPGLSMKNIGTVDNVTDTAQENALYLIS